MREQAQYRSTLQLAQRRGTPSEPDLAIAERDTEWLIPALASGEERLLEVGLYVQARASSLPALHARTERLLSTLHNSLLTAHKTTLEHWQSFQASLPTGRDPLSRTLTTTSSALSALLPFPEEALAMIETGVFVGVTPSGEPILFDPWGPGMDNPHEFWGGISGAGKSFAIKLRIIHETLVRPELQVIVIDPAGEYHQITQAMGGHTIRIAPGSTQRINPFDLMPAGMNLERYLEAQHGDRLAEKIHNLHSFLDILLSDYTPQPTVLTAHEKSLLDKVLYECYRRVGITADPRSHDRPAPLLRDVSAILSEGSVGTDTTGLAARLDRFVSGSLAGLFGRPTNVKLDAPVVAFDLREMRGGSELKPAGIFLISEFLWTQALFDKKPRRCYIDEAWSLIEHEAGGQFLERMAREFRKHYVSVVTITQNPEQFITDPRGSVIAQNAYTKVLKRLDPIGSRAARTAFGLSEAEEQRLTHLPQSKALLLVGGTRLLVEMKATPEEYRLAQTDPDAQESPGASHEPEAARQERHSTILEQATQNQEQREQRQPAETASDAQSPTAQEAEKTSEAHLPAQLQEQQEMVLPLTTGKRRRKKPDTRSLSPVDEHASSAAAAHPDPKAQEGRPT